MQNIFENDFGMLRLELSQHERESYQTHKVKINKEMQGFYKQAKENAKAEVCYICQQSRSSFCNSHSVPKFCLKRIAKDGKVYPSAWNSGLPLFDKEMGIKAAGTFQLICRDCDSKEFQEYEAPEAYSSIPNGKILAQICMKNYLQMISKRKQEIELYKLAAKKPHLSCEMQDAIRISELDLHEYESGFTRAYKASHRNHDDWFYLGYFRKLDYVVPFAFQGMVSLVCGLDGEIINNIYNPSPNYHVEEIHIAVFPLATESVVMLITDSRQKRYRKFYRQLQKLSLEDQLAVINYIIFSYSENVFMSKQLDETVLTDNAFLEMCQTSNIAVSPFPIEDLALSMAAEAFNLSQRNNVPNLLSKKYALSDSA